METEMQDNVNGNRLTYHPLPITSLQTQNTNKKTKIATIKTENIANMMNQLGNMSQNGIGIWVGKNPVIPQTASDDDPCAFGCLVAHKLRCLSARGAMRAQTDIIIVLQKYVLDELDEE